MTEAPAGSWSLAVGDRVVYPNQGVCKVASVETKEIAGQKLDFVTMRREEDGAVVMVPQAKVKSIGLRKIASRDEVDQVFDFLRSDSDKANLDWKQRARTNLDRMNQGGILGLAEVVKGLQVLSELRPLPAKERELYDSARHLLVAELSASLSIPECDAEDAVDLVLFPPGRERPKRTAEEFRPTSHSEEEDEVGLDLNDELMALDSELDLPPDDVPAPGDEGDLTPSQPEPKAAPVPPSAPKRGRPKGAASLPKAKPAAAKSVKGAKPSKAAKAAKAAKTKTPSKPATKAAPAKPGRKKGGR